MKKAKARTKVVAVEPKKGKGLLISWHNEDGCLFVDIRLGHRSEAYSTRPRGREIVKVNADMAAVIDTVIDSGLKYMPCPPTIGTLYVITSLNDLSDTEIRLVTANPELAKRTKDLIDISNEYQNAQWELYKSYLKEYNIDESKSWSESLETVKRESGFNFISGLERGIATISEVELTEEMALECYR